MRYLLLILLIGCATPKHSTWYQLPPNQTILTAKLMPVKDKKGARWFGVYSNEFPKHIELTGLGQYDSTESYGMRYIPIYQVPGWADWQMGDTVFAANKKILNNSLFRRITDTFLKKRNPNYKDGYYRYGQSPKGGYGKPDTGTIQISVGSSDSFRIAVWGSWINYRKGWLTPVNEVGNSGYCPRHNHIERKYIIKTDTVIVSGWLGKPKHIKDTLIGIKFKKPISKQ